MKKLAILLAALLFAAMCVSPAWAEGAVIPEEIVGTWQGQGTPKNDGPPIILVVTVNADGTGDYFFNQNGYMESNPIRISYEGNSFTVDTDKSMLSSCEGTWALEDGVLTLDINSTPPSGVTYSYIAECTKVIKEETGEEESGEEEPAAGASVAAEGPRFVTIGEWLLAEGNCGDCMLAVQVTQVLNPVLAVGADETGTVNLFSGNGEDSMIINFMSDEFPPEGVVLVIANPRYNVFEGTVEMADWTLLRALRLTR